MNIFNMTRDINGYNGFGLPFSDKKYSTILAAGVEQTLVIPKSPYAEYPNILAIFSFAPGSSVWVSLDATAVVPSSSFTAVSSELNPAARYITFNPNNSSDSHTLHFITDDVSDEIGVIFYATV